MIGVTQGGAFAAEVVIKEGGVIKLPSHVDLVAAAGLPVIFGTAHLAIKERAQVKAGTQCIMPPRNKRCHVAYLALLPSHQGHNSRQVHNALCHLYPHAVSRPALVARMAFNAIKMLVCIQSQPSPM